MKTASVRSTASLSVIESDELLREFASASSLTLIRFSDVTLHAGASDETVRRVCLAEDLVLLTSDQNGKAHDSLLQVLHRETDPQWPVLVFEQQKVLASAEAAKVVAYRLIDCLERIETLRGTLIQFLPAT